MKFLLSILLASLCIAGSCNAMFKKVLVVGIPTVIGGFYLKKKYRDYKLHKAYDDYLKRLKQENYKPKWEPLIIEHRDNCTVYMSHGKVFYMED